MVDRTAEFVGNEIAYEAGTEPGTTLRRDRWATNLLPYDHQASCSVPAGRAIPVHRYVTNWGRQCAIFCGVCREFVKHHRRRLGRRSGQHDVWAANGRICIRRVGSELVADEIVESDALPSTLT